MHRHVARPRTEPTRRRPTTTHRIYYTDPWSETPNTVHTHALTPTSGDIHTVVLIYRAASYKVIAVQRTYAERATPLKPREERPIHLP